MLQRLCEGVWNPWLLGGFLAAGLYYSVRTGFFQVFGAGYWLKATVGSLRCREDRRGGLSRLETISTALAATIGTGSIAGVATAIFFGGPGAVFWMWVSAFLGMMLSFGEKTLAVRYRRSRAGAWRGGPMEYMEQGLGSRRMAAWYACGVTAAALAGGAVVQSHSIASGLEAAFGWSRPVIGAVTAAVTAVVVLGGIDRIGAVCQKLVPLMAVLFLGGGLFVILCHADRLLPALGQIVSGAFELPAAAGGGAGYGMMTALRYGVARGVFTNEAGLGTSSMTHAQAPAKHPAEQGMWGIFETFFSTLVVCTVSALVILTSGAYDRQSALTAIENKIVAENMTGTYLVSAAFSEGMGAWGSRFVALCVLLFAFSSLLGWGYYGERGLSRLLGERRGAGLFRPFFFGAIFLGSFGEVTAVWQLSDLCSAMMALPNLTALLLLSPEVLRLWREGIKRSPEA